MPRIRGLERISILGPRGTQLDPAARAVELQPLDPAFSVAGGDDSVTNRMGPAGAWFADIAFLVFGESAFLLPVLVLLAGVFLFRERELPEKRPLICAAGFLLTIATSSGLATLHFTTPDMRETAGGILGQLVGGGLENGARAARCHGADARSVARSRVARDRRLLGSGHGSDRADRVIAAVTELNCSQPRADLARGPSRQATAPRAREQSAREAQGQRAAHRARIEKVEVSAARRALEREKQVPLFEPPPSSELPTLALLDDPPPKEGGYSADALEAMSRLVELKLNDFGVEAEVVAVHPGPVVTRFELKPAAGVKSSQISNLAKDLARSLATVSVRVVEIIPGKPYVGLEIPNEVREIVALGEIVKSQAYDELKSPLTLALGKDIGGQPMVADLGAHAASTDCGHHWLRQVRRPKRDGVEPPVQVHARARPA